MPAKIAKWGNSAGVRIPASVLETAGLSVGDEVDVVARQGAVELRSRRRIPTVQELFAEHLKKYGRLEPPPLVNWGPPVGAEVLPDEDWSDIAPTDEEMGIPGAAGKRSRSRRR
jgi:antitoxin MazE